MATNAIIATLDSNNTPRVRAIRCHWDGLLSGVGKMLNLHYMNRSKVESLIELGNVSCVKEKLYPDTNLSHCMEHSQKDVCLFYMRDDGRTDQEATVYNDVADLMRSNLSERYIYLWIGYTWLVSVNGDEFFPLGGFADLSIPFNSTVFGVSK